MRVMKEMLRPSWTLCWTFFSFLYDFARFALYAGYFAVLRDMDKRDFKIRRTYHSVEKGLSVYGIGHKTKSNAMNELEKLLAVQTSREQLTFSSQVASNVLLEARSKNGPKLIDQQTYFLRIGDGNSEEVGGAIGLDKEILDAGMLERPEEFFFSRVSVRSFSSDSLEDDLVTRALRLASKTPSVCNRQAWHVYHITCPSQIRKCLSLQNGNSGFTDDIRNLLLITCNLKAFSHPGERYQQWIDGGMFAMSLIYALHSLGVSSCCLNWSKGPIADLKLRRACSIRSEDTVIMMLAVGYANESITACASPRVCVLDFYTRVAST